MTSSSYYPVENTIEIALWWGWQTLREYLSSMETYLQEATRQFETRISDYKKTLKPGQVMDEFMADNVEECIYYYDEFPYILRNSFFVSAYSLLEYELNKICRELKKEKSIPFDWTDFRDSPLDNYKNCSTLDKFKHYCEFAALNITFNDPMWQEVKNYSKIRNCISHNNGLLREDAKSLIKYIEENGLIKNRRIISDEAAEQEIGLSQKFCEEVIGTMQKFIDTAYKASIKKD